jgi:hypothetical protein
MSIDQQHLTREELLLFMDGEMDDKAAMQAGVHLVRCRGCSIALERIEGALKKVDALYRAEGLQGNEGEGQRSLLQARLLQEAKDRSGHWWRLPLLQPMAYAAAALLVAILSVGLVQRHAMEQSGYAGGKLVPNQKLTPGATRQVAYEEICPAQDDDKDPAVPTSMQQAVFKEYGVWRIARTREFQVDYLVNPQLGGTGEIRNLWPQPYGPTLWNAHAKDDLEERLHQMVCSREIGISEAQHELATNWIAAYKKYFHTQTPLRREATLAKLGDDEVWMQR